MSTLALDDKRSGWLSSLPGWLAAALLFAVVVAMAPVAGSISRIAFVVGCVVVGWHAWRQGPAAHLQAMLVLFSFAPFARRIVDLFAGFDQAGLMLVGPLLALLVSLPALYPLLNGRSGALADGRAPVLVVLACTIYAALLSLFQGAWIDASAGALKWVAPLLYAFALIEIGERDRLVQAATSAFLVILPIIGLYGIVQYTQLPQWDRYWMQYATAVTAGLPEPYGVRVYSMLNGPASFATFTAVGLLLVTFLRPIWVAVLAAAPALASLMLSQYRTAWISLAIGLIFCLFFSRTRFRAGFILSAIVFALAFALTIPEFNDAIEERLSTLTQGSQDGSFQERLAQFSTLWSMPDSSLFGVGFTTADAGVAGTMPVDGMFIACWLMMGIFVGIICLSGFVWACGRMIRNAGADRSREAVVLGGLGLGALSQMPLASLASGELGFLFWTFAAIACLRRNEGRGPYSGGRHFTY